MLQDKKRPRLAKKRDVDRGRLKEARWLSN